MGLGWAAIITFVCQNFEYFLKMIHLLILYIISAYYLFNKKEL